MSAEQKLKEYPGNSQELPRTDDQELHIDMLELCYRLLEKAWLILLIAAMCAGAVGLYTHLFVPDSYTATAKLFVIGGENSVIDLTSLNLGDKLADDYVQVFKNRDVYNAVQQGFPMAYGSELQYTFTEIQDQLKVTQLNNTRILKISFTSGSPEDALHVVEAYIKAAQSFMDVRMGTSLPSQAFESPYVSAQPTGPNLLRNVLLAFVLGALLAVVIVVCQFVLDDRIRTPEQLEKQLGLATLGLVPVQDSTSQHKERRGNA